MQISEIIAASKFVVLLGKNGAGKSTLLRSLNNHSSFKYISPERGGVLRYDPNVDASMSQNAAWLRDTRHQNRYEQFREQSAGQFRRLELLILREIESIPDVRNNHAYSFDTILESINNLLHAIKIVRSDEGFSTLNKLDNSPIHITQLSSGESELIALAIEVLVFSRSQEQNKILLMDEPDVHLHPDLQHKFIEFVEAVATSADLKVVISTHSTAIIAAFSNTADLAIVPVNTRGQQDFVSFARSKVCEEILPIFGAHPLSTAFNKSPITLVEGEDDKRVLEQVVRSSNGQLKLSPCVVGSVDEMLVWENWLNDMLPAIYDHPRALSLRDLDDAQDPNIDDLGIVCRTRLNCYAIENLLLCDQALAQQEFNPDSFKQALIDWVANHQSHTYKDDMQALVNGYENRRTLKIKNIRNILLAELGTSKPWEVFLGQLIAQHRLQQDDSPHSLQTYLGQKVLTNLFTN